MKLFASGNVLTLEETQKRVDSWDERWRKENPFAGMNVWHKQSGQYIGYMVMGYGEEANSS